MKLDDAPCMDELAGVPWSSLTLDDVNCRDGKLGKFEKHNKAKKTPITDAIRNKF